MASIRVTGGADSIAAELDDLAQLANLLARSGHALGANAAQTLRGVLDSSVSAAAAFDPVGAAEVAGRGIAVAGGLTGAAAEAEGLAVLLHAARQAYRDADDLRVRAEPAVRAMMALPRVAEDLARAPSDLVAGHPGRLQQLLTDDPELLDLAVSAAAGLAGAGLAGAALTGVGPAGAGLTGVGLAGVRPADGARASSVQQVAATAASWYRDGHPVLTAISSGPTDDAAGAPRTLADLTRGLLLRDTSEEDPHAGGGMIDVRFVLHPDGSRAVIVDLPGTTRWNVVPHQASPQVGDFSTNLRSLANQSSAYERGVLLALRAAGVGRAEPILLVGHSEGGLVAAKLSDELRGSSEFTATHVLTAGAPLGLAPLRSSARVLALENRDDVVPHLDGRPNPARAALTTVTVDAGRGSVGEQHALATYLRSATAIDAARDPSVTDWTASAAAFLDGTSVSTQIFQIRRG